MYLDNHDVGSKTGKRAIGINCSQAATSKDIAQAFCNDLFADPPPPLPRSPQVAKENEEEKFSACYKTYINSLCDWGIK